MTTPEHPRADRDPLARLRALAAGCGDDPGRSVAGLDHLFRGLAAALGVRSSAEVGAWDGTASLALRAAVPTLRRCVAFEANPFVVARFRERVDHGGGGVEYRHAAVGAHRGTTTFQVIAASDSPDDDRVLGYNSLYRRAATGWLGRVVYEPATVPATTLDAELADAPAPSAAWIDVEGAVELVVAGAAAFLAHCVLVKVEVEDVVVWRDQWLAGDVAHALGRYGLLPVARDREAVDQYNVIFVRDTAVARDDVAAVLRAAGAEGVVVDPDRCGR